MTYAMFAADQNRTRVTTITPPRLDLRRWLPVIALILLCVGWWLDRSSLHSELARARDFERIAKLQLLERLRHPTAIGRLVGDFPELTRLADRQFDETEFPDRWARIAQHQADKKSVGYAVIVKPGAEESEVASYGVYTVEGRIGYVEVMIPCW
jgi:hypothetical protein